MKKNLFLLCTILLYLIPVTTKASFIIFKNMNDEYIYYRYLYSMDQNGIKTKNINIEKWKNSLLRLSNSKRHASFIAKEDHYSYIYWTFQKQENGINIYNGPHTATNSGAEAFGENAVMQVSYGIDYYTFNFLYFNSDYSRLNIITKMGIIHVFEKTTKPTDQSAPTQLY